MAAKKELSYRERLGYGLYVDPGVDCSKMVVTDEKVARDLNLPIPKPGETLIVDSPQLVEESHARDLDINLIVKRFTPAELQAAAARVDALYGDFATFEGLQEAAIRVQKAQEEFNALPAEVRREFDNDPGLLVRAIDDLERGDKAVEEKLVKLGVVQRKQKEEGVQPPPSPVTPSVASDKA